MDLTLLVYEALSTAASKCIDNWQVRSVNVRGRRARDSAQRAALYRRKPSPSSERQGMCVCVCMYVCMCLYIIETDIEIGRGIEIATNLPSMTQDCMILVQVKHDKIGRPALNRALAEPFE